LFVRQQKLGKLKRTYEYSQVSAISFGLYLSPRQLNGSLIVPYLLLETREYPKGVINGSIIACRTRHFLQQQILINE
jgi:hypothetical protein